MELNNTARLAMRERVMKIVEEQMPALVRVPVPMSIRTREWFREARLERDLILYAFPGFGLSGFSGKLPAVLGALLEDDAQGLFERKPIVLGMTSGNWGKDCGLLHSAFNLKGVCNVVNYGTPEGKINHMRAGSSEVVIAPEGVSSIEWATQMAINDERFHLINQYTHPGSISGHLWTMQHIAKSMKKLRGDNGFIFAAVTGTCSTLIAARRYLGKFTDADVKILGVASMPGAEKIPGSRSRNDLDELVRLGGFPSTPEWNKTLDFPLISNVTKAEAFQASVDIFQETFFPVGPTGGLNIAGVMSLVKSNAVSNTLDALRNRSGKIIFVVHWMDSYLAYVQDPGYISLFR